MPGGAGGGPRAGGQTRGRRRPAGSSATQGVHVIPGRNPVIEALRAGRRVQEVLVDDRSPASADDLGEVAAQARAAGISVSAVARDRLDELTEGVRHQGVVALAPPFPYRALAELSETDLVVVLDGVTDPQNLGSIARSAELAGAGALVLPKKRSVHVTSAAEKAAAGAFSWLEVAMIPNVVRALEELAQLGFWSVGLDGDADTALWDCDLLDGKVVVVVGAEGAGLSRLVRERVDARVAIPMRGHLGSLNAGVATGVALFEIARRRAAAAGQPG